jgi:hypothetical protein
MTWPALDNSTHVHLQSISCLSALSRLVCVGFLTLRNTLFLSHLQNESFSLTPKPHPLTLPQFSLLLAHGGARAVAFHVAVILILRTDVHLSSSFLPLSVSSSLADTGTVPSLHTREKHTHTHTSRWRWRANPTHPHPPSRSPSLHSSPCHPTAILASTVSHPSPRVQLRRYSTHCSWAALLPALCTQPCVVSASLNRVTSLLRPQLTPTHTHTLTKTAHGRAHAPCI